MPGLVSQTDVAVNLSGCSLCAMCMGSGALEERQIRSFEWYTDYKQECRASEQNPSNLYCAMQKEQNAHRRLE